MASKWALKIYVFPGRASTQNWVKLKIIKTYMKSAVFETCNQQTSFGWIEEKIELSHIHLAVIGIDWKANSAKKSEKGHIKSIMQKETS